MSVIAARVYQDKIVVAADSIIVHGWSKRTANFSKLEYINEMIVGGCGEAQECGKYLSVSGGPCLTVETYVQPMAFEPPKVYMMPEE